MHVYLVYRNEWESFVDYVTLSFEQALRIVKRQKEGEYCILRVDPTLNPQVRFDQARYFAAGTGKERNPRPPKERDE